MQKRAVPRAQQTTTTTCSANENVFVVCLCRCETGNKTRIQFTDTFAQNILCNKRIHLIFLFVHFDDAKPVITQSPHTTHNTYRSFSCSSFDFFFIFVFSLMTTRLRIIKMHEASARSMKASKHAASRDLKKYFISSVSFSLSRTHSPIAHCASICEEHLYSIAYFYCECVVLHSV